MDGSKIIDLVSYYEAYFKETGQEDLQDFSVWLNRKLSTKSSSSSRASIAEQNRTLIWLTHRLSKYFRSYAKRVLSMHGLSSMDEYFFLISIQKLGTPAKNEVYKDTISELTTGTQMLRRLIKEGMVKEVVDAHDKRVKRVQLTAKGEKTRQNIFEDFKPELPLKMGNLNQEERKQLTKHLQYLESFHNTIYHEDADLSMEELLKKHLL